MSESWKCDKCFKPLTEKPRSHPAAPLKDLCFDCFDIFDNIIWDHSYRFFKPDLTKDFRCHLEDDNGTKL